MYPTYHNGNPQQRIARAFDFDPKEFILTIRRLQGHYSPARPADLTTPAAQYFLAKMADLIDQRGGPDCITPDEKMIIANAAAIDLELAILRGEIFEQGKRVEAHVFGTLSKIRRGLLDSVGLKRRKRHINPKSLNGEFTEVEVPNQTIGDLSRMRRTCDPPMRRTR